MTEPIINPEPATGGHVLASGPGETATPAWMHTSTKPLEAALRGTGQEHIGPAATLWPLGQASDTATRADRYLPDTNRHPQRTRAALTGYVIAKYSRPGQVVFDGFVGSGTTMVEAVYAGRHAVGVDQDVRWVDLSVRNLTFAHEHGATGNALVLWADTRDLSPIPRRLRHRVDLVLATPPLQFKPNDIPGRIDDATIIAALERDMRIAIGSWIPMLHPGTTLVFTSRLVPAVGYLIDPSVAIAAAARQTGLQLIERVAALRVPVREATSGSLNRSAARKRRTVPIVHDDVLIYQVPSAAPRWRRGR
jgi:16S rRNA G966 N2-methylase RsmD